MSTLPRLPETVQSEFNCLMLGKKLGQGQFRDVYEFLPDPRLVVKFELGSGCEFSNVAEWQVWQEIEHTEWARWFAPCKWISHSGSVLMQERTAPVVSLPKKLPNFMCDLKTANFGKLRGRVVAHDYAFHKLFSRGLRGAKLVDRV